MRIPTFQNCQTEPVRTINMSLQLEAYLMNLIPYQVIRVFSMKIKIILISTFNCKLSYHCRSEDRNEHIFFSYIHHRKDTSNVLLSRPRFLLINLLGTCLCYFAHSIMSNNFISFLSHCRWSPYLRKLIVRLATRWFFLCRLCRNPCLQKHIY